MSRQSRVAVAAIVGLLVGLGTLAAVVLVLRDVGEGPGAAVPATGAADTGAAAAAATTEPTPIATTRTIRVGGFPNAVAVGAGSVWVMRDGRRLLRVDPAREAVVARVGVGDGLHSERPCGVAAGKGAVWVTTASGKVARVNPRTNRLARLIDVEGAACVAVGAGAVWVTSPNRGVVTRIDPKTNKVTAEIHAGSVPEGIATGFGSVWVATSDAPGGRRGAVVRINRRTNKVTARTHVPNVPEYLAVTRAGIWVTANDGTIRRVDPDGNRLQSGAIRVAEDGSTTLAAAPEVVWAAASASADNQGVVRRVDAATGELENVVIQVGQRPLGMAFGAGRLWVADYGSGTISVYTPGQGASRQGAP